MKNDRTKKMWIIATDAPLQSVLDRPDAPPLLRQTLTGALSWQTRNETPVRRALRSPRIAPQWMAALLALGATVTVEGEAGPEEVALAVGTGLPRLHALHVPRTEGTRWGAAHVARTPADEPIVAAVAVVEMTGGIVQQARVALTGVWPEAVRLAEAPARLVGGPLDETSIGAVAVAVEEEVAPTEDFMGSEEYRRAMAGVLTRRALEQCLHQEAGDE
jgi:CO/xanthine dehydrogenase FAD-binding subunit